MQLEDIGKKVVTRVAEAPDPAVTEWLIKILTAYKEGGQKGVEELIGVNTSPPQQ